MELGFYLAIAFTVFCRSLYSARPSFFALRPKPSASSMSSPAIVRTAATSAKGTGPGRYLESGRDLRARFGLADNVKLKRRLLEAGFRDKSTVDSFFAIQLACPLLGAFAGSFINDNTAFWVFALAVVGYMAPDFWLTKKTSPGGGKIRRSIPDCLDLLVICVDAGLGIDQALVRVSSELSVSHPDINEELTQVNLEQRAGKQGLKHGKESRTAPRSRSSKPLSACLCRPINSARRF